MLKQKLKEKITSEGQESQGFHPVSHEGGGGLHHITTLCLSSQFSLPKEMPSFNTPTNKPPVFKLTTRGIFKCSRTNTHFSSDMSSKENIQVRMRVRGQVKKKDHQMRLA